MLRMIKELALRLSHQHPTDRVTAGRSDAYLWLDCRRLRARQSSACCNVTGISIGLSFESRIFDVSLQQPTGERYLVDNSMLTTSCCIWTCIPITY